MEQKYKREVMSSIYEKPTFRVLCSVHELCAMSATSTCKPSRFKRDHSVLIPEIIFERRTQHPNPTDSLWRGVGKTSQRKGGITMADKKDERKKPRIWIPHILYEIIGNLGADQSMSTYTNQPPNEEVRKQKKQ